MTIDWTTLMVTIPVMLTAAGMLFGYIDSRRKETEADLERQIDAKFTQVTIKVDHNKANQAAINQSVEAKIKEGAEKAETFTTEIVRLDTIQKQQTAAINEIKQEIKDVGDKIERDVEKLGESLLLFVKSENEHTREAQKQQMETVMAAIKASKA